MIAATWRGWRSRVASRRRARRRTPAWARERDEARSAADWDIAGRVSHGAFRAPVYSADPCVPAI